MNRSSKSFARHSTRRLKGILVCLLFAACGSSKDSSSLSTDASGDQSTGQATRASTSTSTGDNDASSPTSGSVGSGPVTTTAPDPASSSTSGVTEWAESSSGTGLVTDSTSLVTDSTSLSSGIASDGSTTFESCVDGPFPEDPQDPCDGFQTEAECLAAGCTVFSSFKRYSLPTDTCECVNHGYVKVCLKTETGDIIYTPEPTPLYRVVDGIVDVGLFSYDPAPMPIGWHRCGTADPPPLACECPGVGF